MLTTQIKEALQQESYKAALLLDLGNNNLNSQTVQIAVRDIIMAYQIPIDITADSLLAPGKVSHAQLVDKIIKTTLKMIQK